MSQIFTDHYAKKCDICNEDMITLQAGRFKCVCCGFKDDNY